MKHDVSRGFVRVAKGSRTPDLRNHNPNSDDSKPLSEQAIASLGSDGCTNGCTNLSGVAQIAEELSRCLTNKERIRLAALLLQELD